MDRRRRGWPGTTVAQRGARGPAVPQAAAPVTSRAGFPMRMTTAPRRYARAPMRGEGQAEGARIWCSLGGGGGL